MSTHQNYYHTRSHRDHNPHARESPNVQRIRKVHAPVFTISLSQNISRTLHVRIICVSLLSKNLTRNMLSKLGHACTRMEKIQRRNAS